MTPADPVRPSMDCVDDFVMANDPDGSLAGIDTIISSALPDAKRMLWKGTFWGGTEQSIIGYGVITQPRPAPRPPVRWFLIGLARQKSYLSLYVNASEDDRYLAPTYAPTLGKVKAGAASLSFANADCIDTDVLTTMLHHAARLVPPGK